MISFFAFAAFLNFIVSLLLGIIVFSKTGERRTVRFFILYFWAVAFWSFGYYYWQISDNSESALFWCRVLMIGAILIPAFYLNFIIDFLKIFQRNKLIIYLTYFSAFLFLVANLTSYFVADVGSRLTFDYWPVPGPLYFPFLAFFFVIICYGLYLLFHAYRIQTDRITKQQIKYFLIGTSVGFIGGATNYPLWYGVPLLPYGNILVSFGVLFVAFASLKYHLFEIKTIFTELMVALMGVILIVLPFLMPTFGLRLLTTVLLFLFFIFSYYLVRAIEDESRRREKAETVAARERHLREEAEVLTIKLKNLDEAKTQFLLSTQHHLRSPLSVVQGYLSMISEGSYGQISLQAKEKIDSSLVAAKELIEIVDELLDVAHYQMNEGVVAKKQVDITLIVSQIINDLSSLAKQKKIYLNFQSSEPGIPLISVDPSGIREAIYNIVDNAIKYTQKGGVTVSVSKDGENLRVCVIDTGIGMDKLDSKNLFSRTFERGKNAKVFNATGKGIGLYLAAQMIAGNGGKIRVESEGRDKGSTFIIDLPINVVGK